MFKEGDKNPSDDRLSRMVLNKYLIKTIAILIVLGMILDDACMAKA